MNAHLQYTPDAEHRFWLYSPEGDGFTFWRTIEERDAYAEEEIRTYLDDTWCEDVEGVMAGVVTHTAKPVNIQRPFGFIDDDGYDEDGEGPWDGPDSMKCDYALVPLPEVAP